MIDVMFRNGSSRIDVLSCASELMHSSQGRFTSCEYDNGIYCIPMWRDSNNGEQRTLGAKHPTSRIHRTLGERPSTVHPTIIPFRNAHNIDSRQWC